jgi:hypothetical protein
MTLGKPIRDTITSGAEPAGLACYLPASTARLVFGVSGNIRRFVVRVLEAAQEAQPQNRESAAANA